MKTLKTIRVLCTVSITSFFGMGFLVDDFHTKENLIESDYGINPELQPSGEILGFYTDLIIPSPQNVDIVSFSKMNGGNVVISPPLATVNTNMSPFFLPTCSSAFDFISEELVCLISGEEILIAYNDNPPAANPIVNLSPLSPTAPQFLNNSLYGILIENGGVGSGPDVDIEIVNNIQTGIVDGILPFNFVPAPGYYFNHEQTSSATNGVDEIYFVSGSNLIIFNNSVPLIPVANWIDLGPSNLFFYHGLEYKSPGVFWAMRINHINPSLELVEILINGNTLTGINTLYDLQSKVTPAPPGWILNSEYYSTTLDTCDMRYYISTLYDDMIGSSRLIEIDVPNNSHVEQINPKYLFGIEITDLACDPCSVNLTSNFVDSCGHVQILSNSPGALDYTWCSGENTENLDLMLPCGTHDFCISVTCADGTLLTDSITITIADNNLPNIVCPSNIQLQCDDDLTPANTGTASATDNCPIIAPISYMDDTLFMIPCDGVIQRTWSVTDWCNNTSTCVQNITVLDNVSPVIVNCPPDMTVYGTLDTLGNCTGFVSLINPTATDNCSGNVGVVNNINGTGNPSGVFSGGTTTVNWMAVDSCMNSSTCTTAITMLCDSCYCVGFDSIQFSYASWNLFVDCGNMPALDLPCIPFDGLYQLSGNFQCTDSCQAQVLYEIISLDNGNVISGTMITYPVGGNNHKFDLIGGFNYPPGNYQLILDGSCTGDLCQCVINFTIPDCPAIVCCTDEDEFSQRILDNISIVVDDDNKSVELIIEDILECDSISIRTWGDPHVQESGKKGRWDRFQYNYMECGTYQIEYLAEAFENDTFVCLEKIFTSTINVSCGDCPCESEDIQELIDAVNKGFATISTALDCKVCLAPLDLGDCETVEWYEGNLNTPTLGTSSGNQSFCYDFINPGNHTIIMLVQRYKDDGSVCEIFSKEQTVNVNCNSNIACEHSILSNPGFNEGAVAGGLNPGGTGKSDSWIALSGIPEVVEGSPGSLDGWTINLANESKLTKAEPKRFGGESGIVKLRFGIKEKGIKSPVMIQLFCGENFEEFCDSTQNVDQCINLARIDVDPLELNTWYEMEIPYDLGVLNAMHSCDDSEEGLLARIVAYSGRGVNPTARRNHIEIDNFCMEEGVVSVKEIINKGTVIFYPNPVKEELFVTIDNMSPIQIEIQILNLYGSLIQTNRVSGKHEHHSFSMSGLPSGVYFVKIFQNGIHNWTEKIVKL